MLKIIKTTDGRGYMVLTSTGDYLGFHQMLEDAIIDASFWVAAGFGCDYQFEHEIPLS